MWLEVTVFFRTAIQHVLRYTDHAPQKVRRRRLTASAKRTSPKCVRTANAPRPPPSSRRSQRCHPTLNASDQAQVFELELAHELLEQCDDGPTVLEVEGHLFEHLALALGLS